MHNLTEIKSSLDQIQQILNEKKTELEKLEREQKKAEKQLNIAADTIADTIADSLDIDKERFTKFFEKPYVIIPVDRNKCIIAVPRFVKGFQVGWLLKETDSFYLYEFNQYSKWFGDVPSDILDAIELQEEFKATVVNGEILFDPEKRDAIKKYFGEHVSQISNDGVAKIKRGHEFEVIVDMIESGNLPFTQKPVSKDDIRQGESNIELYPYQATAFNQFLKKGAIGLFHPTGAGKSVVSCKIMDVTKGKKIIFVPAKTLIEQWEDYIETFIPHIANEITLTTYQGGYKLLNEEYSLAIFDECHKLPANTFSKLSVLNTKYRIGLSASPHREDGRESYIIALTGFPVGLDWQSYIEETGKKLPPIYVHIVPCNDKMSLTWRLLDNTKKTFIFCDSLKLGQKVADKLNIPFVHGETEERLKVLKDNKHVVCSRVIDLGTSVKDLERIVEIDFLFGSRQQQLQRTGRLMHSKAKDQRHDIIFTADEYERYQKRLWALTEKGFTIKIINH